MTFFQERIWYGGPKDSVYASQLGDLSELFRNLTTTYTDPTTGAPNEAGITVAYDFPTSSGEFAPCRFLVSLRQLFTGNKSVESTIDRTSDTLALGLTNTSINPQTFNGSIPVQPVRYESSFAFVAADQVTIYEANQ